MARILVIDDDPDVRTLTQDMLEDAGHEVALAANGVEGIEVYRRQPADVVITDLYMPDKEGIETIAELTRAYPGVRIIAMSGGGRSRSSDLYLATASALGVGAVLRKPFDRAALLAAVDRSLSAEGADETLP